MRTVPRGEVITRAIIRRACDLVWPTSFVRSSRLAIHTDSDHRVVDHRLHAALDRRRRSVRGGHNNWDRGQVVAPLATHNVLIASLAGLWIIPPGPLSSLLAATSPGARLNRTFYALTDRRALIISARLPGPKQDTELHGRFARIDRARGTRDGTGDLIFACPSTWMSR